MNLAIMQPYFFPYIGYFQLIKAVDQFILLNEVQYIRHGWINRNRILKPGGGVQYIIVPLQKHQQKSLIAEILVAELDEWKLKILRQIEHYKKKAPFYKQVATLLEEAFQVEAKFISELNQHLLQVVCNYLGIKTNIISSSALSLNYNNIKAKDEWALSICEQLHASEYINPIGGIELFEKEKFQRKNIKLYFLRPHDICYPQYQKGFETNLSILDVMMFNEPIAIHKMIQQYQII